MSKILKTLVLAIVGMTILGLGFITSVEAVKPPPPDGFPDATRIFPGREDNDIHESEASYIMNGWYYYVGPDWDDKEAYPQPIDFQAWIDGKEVKLSRNSIGNGNLADTLIPPENVEYAVGPLFQWYAYFEPYTFDPGVYVTRALWTCKDPNSPSDRIEVLEVWGFLNVLEG